MKRRISSVICAGLWTLSLAFVILPVQAQELALGSELPGSGVALQDVNGGAVSITGLTGETGTVVVFWSNQCPWVDKYTGRFKSIVEDFGGRGVNFVLVNSNDGGAYPKESIEESASASRTFGDGVTYVADQSSGLAKAFGAERTPHVYVFDTGGELVYVGTIDDSPGDPGNVTSEYLRTALDALTGGRDIPVSKTKAFGCTIKFKG